jgi:hypothetical protein
MLWRTTVIQKCISLLHGEMFLQFGKKQKEKSEQICDRFLASGIKVISGYTT